MNMPAATRTGDVGRPGLTGAAPARPLRTVLSLAGAEAALLLRSMLVLAGLLAGGAVVWRVIWTSEPVWWNAAWQIGYGQVILAASVLAAAQLTASRARRDGMRELYDSFPVSAATRTLAHVAALAGVLPATVLLACASVALTQARGVIGTPSPAVLAAGVMLVLAAGAAGIALGTRFAHPLAGILGGMVLFVLFTQSYRLLAYPALGGLPWLFPWTIPDQLGSLPGPLAGYPPGGAHALELAGVALLAAVAALMVTKGGTRHRMRLAVTAIVAVAVIGAGVAAQLPSIPTATLNRLFSAAANPVPAEHCTTEGQVKYCLYPGFGAVLPALQAPVSGVLSQLPVRPTPVLTIAQDTSLALDDPPLTHGHTRAQMDRWNAELQVPPPSTATAPAIYVTEGDERAARFALALGTAEWAVNLPAENSPVNPAGACVALDQAREAIAIWLAITATHASLTRGPGIQAVLVHDTQVVVWIYPGEYDNYTSAPGPQTTVAGLLLAKAMASLPEGKVERVLGASWPTWLNWHTTDAQLAAALGIPMPSVPVPASPLPPGTSPPAQAQNPLCT